MRTFSTTLALASIAFIATAVSALGINCKGSSECSYTTDYSIASTLNNAIQGSDFDSNQFFSNGKQLACVETIDGFGASYFWCAYLTNTNGAPGSSIKAASANILKHGCKVCGSDPFYNNDVSEGELTFNYVGGSDDCSHYDSDILCNQY